MSFAVNYGQDPWAGIDRDVTPYYVPELQMTFYRNSVYAAFTTFAVRLQRTNQMIFNEVFTLEYNKTPVDSHALWLEAQYIDSRQLQITTETHAGKVALHKNDQYTSFWRTSGDLRGLCSNLLGISMTQHIDEITRDAYLDGPFWLVQGHQSDGRSASGYPDFSALTATDLFNPNVADSIWLIMADKMLPGAQDPRGLGTSMMFGVLSHNVYHDFTTNVNSEYYRRIEVVQDRSLLMNYEVGIYRNCRYIRTPLNVLHNCGTIVHQTDLTANAALGSGAALTVDQVYTVGQQALRTHSAGGVGQRYVTVTDASGFAVGQKVTLHKTRTGRNGVTNGVDYREGTLTDRRIISIDGNNIALDKPIIKCEYDTGDFVTLALDVHACIFIGGPNGVVHAVTQPPSVHVPPTIDDRMAQWRLTWDMTSKPQKFRVEWFYVVYCAATGVENILS